MWGCSLCDVPRTVGPRQLSEHFGGSRHITRARANLHWQCTICDVAVTGEQPWLQHLAGGRHESAVAAAQSAELEDAPSAESSSTTGLLEPAPDDEPSSMSDLLWGCPLCKIARTMAPVSIDMHLRGQRHWANAQWKGTWHCPICDVHSSGEPPFIQHMNGRLHAARLEELIAEVAHHRTAQQAALSPGGPAASPGPGDAESTSSSAAPSATASAAATRPLPSAAHSDPAAAATTAPPQPRQLNDWAKKVFRTTLCPDFEAVRGSHSAPKALMGRSLR